MGFAKYMEDIVSRYVADNYRGRPPSQAPVAKGAIPARPSAAPVPAPSPSHPKPVVLSTAPSMSKLKDLTLPNARPLPVIVLADVSGSMNADGKIQSLNQALKEMLESFKDEDDLRAEIHVAVLTFGGGRVHPHLPLASAQSAVWTEQVAAGNTPMGAAFRAARALVEDKTAIPGRAYRPTLVLLSDGQPTDEWKAPLKELLDSERGGKAFRMALGIGADADTEVLSAFLNDPHARVFKADEARQIRQFFRLVTMSVTSRSRSANPNVAPQVNTAEEWDL